MGEALEIAKVMVQPAMKLLEMCGNAIGTVYEPRHMRKMADAEVYKIKKLGNAIIETDSLPIAYNNGEISMNTLDLEDFAKRAELRAKHQMLREQNNIERVVGKAYQELLDAPEVPSDPVDEDWTTRFFNIVKEINTEEMQCLWSKILVGEVARPGSFSMRTLETIRNLSQFEAALFQKFCNCAVQFDDDVIVPNDLQLLNSKGVSYTDLIVLSEAGLINLKELRTAARFPPNVTMHMQLYNKTHLIHITGKTENTTLIDCGIYKLTKVGAEIYKVLETISDEQYIVNLAKKIAVNNMHKANVFVHRIISHTEGNIRCETPPIFLQEQINKK